MDWVGPRGSPWKGQEGGAISKQPYLKACAMRGLGLQGKTEPGLVDMRLASSRWLQSPDLGRF